MHEFIDRNRAESFIFYRVPKLLFTDPEFRKMTAESRVLYGLLLDRMGLSQMNGWRDELDRVYIYFKIEEVMACLHCAKQKAVKLLKELENAGLIERRKQGQGRPDRIYVKNFSSKVKVEEGV